MRNHLFHKLEFWLLSVPALVVLFGALAHYGSWRILWAFAFGFVFAAVLRIGKEAFAGALLDSRCNACRAGNTPKAFALALLIEAYEWFVVVALADVASLILVWRWRGSMPLPFVYATVFAISFAVPSLVRTIQRRTDGGYGEIFVELERLLLLAAIPVSAFANLTPALFMLGMIGFGFVALSCRCKSVWQAERKRVAEFLQAEKSGVPFAFAHERRWFPRPGIVFEPPEELSGPMAQRVPSYLWFQRRRSLIIESVSPMAFVGLILLAGGAIGLIDSGHACYLLAGLVLIIPVVIALGCEMAEEKGRKVLAMADYVAYAIGFSILATLALWLAKDSWAQRVVISAFLVGCFEFPAQYVVRATTECRTDWRRPFFSAGVVVFALWMATRFVPWWSLGFIGGILFSILYALMRFVWPPKSLRDGRKEAASNTPDEDSAAPSSKHRRDRKRERQLNAFRRSQGR